MTYLALARKYRPTRFADLVAQGHVAAGLSGAVAKNRVAHAYLLTGPRGVGKTSAARILAMALNCERREQVGEGEPCGTCDSCRRIWSGAANLDVVEIDAASNRGVDDARELRERATYAASGPERHKVYIIDEAHMLTREAWNALLKILEEPPPRVVFVFATTEPQKIANTAAPVMSRVQRFDFHRLGPHTIVERLEFVAHQEGLEAEDDALLLMARVARGGMRDALSLLDQAVAFGEGTITAQRVREALGLIGDELYAELLGLVAGRRTQDVFPFVAGLVESGADLVEFVGGAGETLRALLVHLLGGQPEGITETLRHALEHYAPSFAAGDLMRMLKLLSDVETSIRRSPHARLHVELLLLQWSMLDRTVELADVLAALRGETPLARIEEAAPRASSSPSPPSAPPSSPAHSTAPLTAPPDLPEETQAPQPSTVAVPLTPEGLAQAWSKIVSEVGRRRRMIRESLAQARPVSVEGDRVVLEVSHGEAHLEGLERTRRTIQGVIEAVTGHRVRLAFRSADEQPASSEHPTNPSSSRLTDATDRAERLRVYRSKDPALDAAADALDLELLE